MVMRGVQKLQAKTMTSCMLGTFREDPKTRDDLWQSDCEKFYESSDAAFVMLYVDLYFLTKLWF